MKMQRIIHYGVSASLGFLIAPSVVSFTTNLHGNAAKKSIINLGQYGAMQYPITGNPTSTSSRLYSADADTDNDGGGMDRRAVVALTSLLVLAGGGGVNIAMIDQTNAQSAVDSSAPVVNDGDSITWQGTSLSLLSLQDAYEISINQPTNGGLVVFPFAHWPDPILRRPASVVKVNSNNQQQQQRDSPSASTELLTKLQTVARTLQRTARKEEAVGLAAQQCGIDVSLVYLERPPTKIDSDSNSNRNPDSSKDNIFLLNPRIVDRSPERDMQVWNEECLVLPPSFRATLLRDATVTVEYETLFVEEVTSSSSRKSSASTNIIIPPFSTQQITLTGELARAVQHEMQHDTGILITDHVGLDELLPFMRDYEREQHDNRMEAAFRRDISNRVIGIGSIV